MWQKRSQTGNSPRRMSWGTAEPKFMRCWSCWLFTRTGADVSTVTLAETSWVSTLSTSMMSGAACRSFSLWGKFITFHTGSMIVFIVSKWCGAFGTASNMKMFVFLVYFSTLKSELDNGYDDVFSSWEGVKFRVVKVSSLQRRLERTQKRWICCLNVTGTIVLKRQRKILA